MFAKRGKDQNVILNNFAREMIAVTPHDFITNLILIRKLKRRPTIK